MVSDAALVLKVVETPNRAARAKMACGNVMFFASRVPMPVLRVNQIHLEVVILILMPNMLTVPMGRVFVAETIAFKLLLAHALFLASGFATRNPTSIAPKCVRKHHLPLATVAPLILVSYAPTRIQVVRD
jgi:hypothetical protein